MHPMKALALHQAQQRSTPGRLHDEPFNLATLQAFNKTSASALQAGVQATAQTSVDQASAEVAAQASVSVDKAKETISAAVQQAYVAQRAQDLLPPEFNNAQVNQAVLTAVATGTVTSDAVRKLISTAFTIGTTALCGGTGPFAPLCGVATQVVGSLVASVFNGAHAATPDLPPGGVTEEDAARVLLTSNPTAASDGTVALPSPDFLALVQKRSQIISQAFSLFSNNPDSITKIQSVVDDFFAPEQTLEAFIRSFTDPPAGRPDTQGLYSTVVGSELLPVSLPPNPPDGFVYAIRGTCGPISVSQPYAFATTEHCLVGFGRRAVQFNSTRLGYGFMLPFVPPEVVLGQQAGSRAVYHPAKGPFDNPTEVGPTVWNRKNFDPAKAVYNLPQVWAADYFDAIGKIMEKNGIAFGPALSELKGRISSYPANSYWLQRLKMYRDLCELLYEVLEGDLKIRLSNAYTAAAIGSKVALVDSTQQLADVLIARSDCQTAPCVASLRRAAADYAARTVTDGPEAVVRSINQQLGLGDTGTNGTVTTPATTTSKAVAVLKPIAAIGAAGAFAYWLHRWAKRTF